MNFIKYTLLIVTFAILQYNIWIKEGFLRNIQYKKNELEQKELALNQLKKRNENMKLEIEDLQTGNEIISEIAREKLNYIKRNEVFYRIIK